jgi:hypothetical protein
MCRSDDFPLYAPPLYNICLFYVYCVFVFYLCIVLYFYFVFLPPPISQMNRLMLTEATAASLAAADASNFTVARGSIEHALNTILASPSFNNRNPVSETLVQELRSTLNNVASAQEYSSRGGRAMMSEQMQGYSGQRQVYSKSATPSPYQSSSSMAHQSKANRSKASK